LQGKRKTREKNQSICPQGVKEDCNITPLLRSKSPILIKFRLSLPWLCTNWGVVAVRLEWW
jgi:hypothetical protein